jgi:arsenite methyltransferase
MFARFLARQLANPSGLFGRLVLAPTWNRRNAALNDMAFDRLALQPRDRVMEVGVGGGYLLGRMAAVVTDGFLVGIDASPTMLAFCERRHRALVRAGRLELKCAEAESLPYPSGHVTKVCTVNSIFYWKDAPHAFAEMHRVLQAGGLLVICFTCRTSLEDRSFARHGLTLYDADDVAQLMESSGFRDTCVTRASDRYREFVCLTGRKDTRG